MLYCVSLIPFCNFSSTKETKSSTPGSTYSKIIPGVQGLHTQKLSLASRVYILKNYPWRPGSTYYSKTISDIQGLHNMKETWNRHEKSTCQSAGHCHTLLWCCNVFIDILFAISVPQKQNQNLQPQGLHTQKLSLASRVYILLKKNQSPWQWWTWVVCRGPDSEAGLAHDPTGMN